MTTFLATSAEWCTYVWLALLAAFLLWTTVLVVIEEVVRRRNGKARDEEFREIEGELNDLGNEIERIKKEEDVILRKLESRTQSAKKGGFSNKKKSDGNG